MKRNWCSIMKTIKINNKTNWFLTFVLGFGLIMISFIILILLPLIAFQQNSFLLSVFSYFFSTIPFLAFFVLFLYIWLWNTFGKTILKFDDEKIIVIKKCKLFTPAKTYYRRDIKIGIEDFKIEKTKYFTRYNIFTSSTFSIVFHQNNSIKRVIDWQSLKKSEEILKAIQ